MSEIRVQALAKAYGSRCVLEDIILDVPDGSVLALLGPSGCGKTTLLRLIAGFERPDRGSILIGPDVVESEAVFVPPERRRIGYVPQEGALFPHLTVAKNVGYGLSDRARKAAQVQEVLGLVGLADYAGHYPHQLSGGQQQRVALARALAPKPQVVLLDEPFSALDLDLRRRMSEEVVSLLRSQGATAVLVTHDPAEAYATADLVAVMQHGRARQCGTPTAIYRQPASREVAHLTGEAIWLDGEVCAGYAKTGLGPVSILGECPSDGTRVAVLLRPEQISLCHRDEGTPAVVVGRQFRGGHTLLMLDVAGVPLQLRVAIPPGEDAVFVRVAGACPVFRDDGSL